MAENSKIEWTTHTFNPWRGCTKWSPGCANCYAETLSKRNPAVLGEWGPGKPRVLASARMWKQPIKWDITANNTRLLNGEKMLRYQMTSDGDFKAYDTKAKTTIFRPDVWAALPAWRPRVFCASLADWLDDEVPIEWLVRLMALIVATPNLDWLLLTKRIENLRPRMERVLNAIPRTNITLAEASARALAEAWLTTGGSIIHNIWLGTSVENQDCADKRIPVLLSIPAKVRFLSCEPLLGPVDLRKSGGPGTAYKSANAFDGNALFIGEIGGIDFAWSKREMLHWVICGGESGPDARPMHPDWARSLRDQCKAVGVPFLFKQWGEWMPAREEETVSLHSGYCHPEGRGAKWPSPPGLGEYGPRELEARGFAFVARVGKAKAGRLLDGREWNEFPAQP